MRYSINIKSILLIALYFSIGIVISSCTKENSENLIVEELTIDTELLPYDDINTVTLYLNPKRQIGYYDYIVSLNPERVIFNPGTENSELYKILKASS